MFLIVLYCSSDPDVYGTFDIGPGSGVVTLTNPLDYERISLYQLKVLASDREGALLRLVTHYLPIDRKREGAKWINIYVIVPISCHTIGEGLPLEVIRQPPPC